MDKGRCSVWERGEQKKKKETTVLWCFKGFFFFFLKRLKFIKFSLIIDWREIHQIDLEHLMTKTLRAKQSEAKPQKGSRRLAQEGGDVGVAETLLVRSMLHHPAQTPHRHPPSFTVPSEPSTDWSPASETSEAPSQRRVCDAKHGDVFKCKIVWRQATARESDGTQNAFVAGCNAPQTNSAIFIAWRSRKSFWIHARSPGGSKPRWLMHRRDTGHCCVTVWRSAK